MPSYNEIENQIVKEKFIISKIYGAFYEIYNFHLGNKRAILKGKLRLENSENRHPFVVGDRILAELPSPNSDWVILSKEDRKNFLVRKSHNTDAHVLSANVDFVVILVSLADPETKDGFIDRSITAIYSSGAEAIILFNKKDLVSKEELFNRENKYNQLGYKTFAVTCTDKNSIHDITDFIQNKTSYLVGNSGVGKSTFINLLTENPTQKTNIISDSTRKGKHTTTNSALIVLNETTYIIDSPGIKEWGLLHLSEGEIYQSFPEFKKIKSECKITKCCIAERECPILENIDLLEEDRKKSLDSMLEGLDIPYRVRVGNLKSGKIRKVKKSYKY